MSNNKVYLTSYEEQEDYKIEIGAALAIENCASILSDNFVEPPQPTNVSRSEQEHNRILLREHNVIKQKSHGIIIASLTKMKTLQKLVLNNQDILGKEPNGHKTYFTLMDYLANGPISANQLAARTEFHIERVKLGADGLLQPAFDQLDILHARLTGPNAWTDYKKIQLLYNLCPAKAEFIDTMVAQEKDYDTITNLLISKQHAEMNRENRMMKSSTVEQSSLKKAEESQAETVNFANYAQVYRKRDYDSDSNDFGKRSDGNDSDSGRKHHNKRSNNRDVNGYPPSNHHASSSSSRSRNYQQPNNFSSSSSYVPRKIYCFECKKEGHKRPDCPELSSSYGPKKGKYNDNK